LPDLYIDFYSISLETLSSTKIDNLIPDHNPTCYPGFALRFDCYRDPTSCIIVDFFPVGMLDLLVFCCYYFPTSDVADRLGCIATFLLVYVHIMCHLNHHIPEISKFSISDKLMILKIMLCTLPCLTLYQKYFA